MNLFINCYLIVFIAGLLTFFNKKFFKIENIRIAKIFLFSGLILFLLYILQFLKLINFAGIYSENIMYGLSLSCIFLSECFGIRTKYLKFINWIIFSFNIPILHTLIVVLLSSLFNIQLYKVPKVLKESRQNRIQSEAVSYGLSMNENIVYVQKKFPFEKKILLFDIPRSKYLDSLKITEENNKIHIRYLGKDSLGIDTTFNIK